MKSAILSALAAFLCLGVGNAQIRGPVANLEFPSFRYVLWSDLTDAFRVYAQGLGYNKATWELPGTNDIEFNSWVFLAQSDESNAVAMGYDEDVWDCYQHHYEDYEWSELVEFGTAQYFEAFGWDEDSWNVVTDAPAAFDNFWVDLTTAQQDAAKELCFFREEVWNGEVPFPEWAQTASPTETPNASPSGTPTATPVPTESTISPQPTPAITNSPSEMPSVSEMPTSKATMAPTKTPTTSPSPTDGTFRGPAENIEYPKFRFIVWELSDDTTTQAATAFSYGEDSWNTPGNNPMEDKGWNTFDSTQRSLLGVIGFSADVWECYVNHYDDSEWTLLEYIDIAKYFEVLGWDEDSWNEVTDPPASVAKSWNELNTEEQEAAGELCYFEELWDQTALVGDNWDGSSAGDGSIATLSMSISLIVASAFGALLLII
jgi:hypothetical protein